MRMTSSSRDLVELLEIESSPLSRILEGTRTGTVGGKNHITHIEDGFDFLGQHVRKYNGHFLDKPGKEERAKRSSTDIRKVIKG